MAKQRVGNTALGAAICRLIEQYQGSPWLFGLEPASVASFLEPFHLRLLADVGSADYQANYFKPMKRELVVSEMERIAQATVIGS